MLISTHTLQNIVRALFMTASLLLMVLLHQALLLLSNQHTHPLKSVTFDRCNGAVCETVISRK